MLSRIANVEKMDIWLSNKFLVAKCNRPHFVRCQILFRCVNLEWEERGILRIDEDIPALVAGCSGLV